MGRPIKRQFFGFNVPLTTQGIGKKQNKNAGKQESKITEIKTALQSTKENRTSKVETQSKKKKKKIKRKRRRKKS